MLRSVLAILAVLLLGAAGASAYWKFVMVPGQQGSAPGRGGPSGPVAVEAQAVRVGLAETSLDAVGTLISNELVVLRPEVSGRVASINFGEGGMIPKGTVLVELDSSIERAELAQAEAARALAHSNFERARSCAATMPAPSARSTRPRRSMRTADAAVDLAQARLDKRKLVAPFDSWAACATSARAPSSPRKPRSSISSRSTRSRWTSACPSCSCPLVVPGQRITVEIDAFPGEPFVGQV